VPLAHAGAQLIVIEESIVKGIIDCINEQRVFMTSCVMKNTGETHDQTGPTEKIS
jgi:hypothetical protein